jgi:hypothetical protein
MLQLSIVLGGPTMVKSLSIELNIVLPYNAYKDAGEMEGICDISISRTIIAPYNPLRDKC